MNFPPGFFDYPPPVKVEQPNYGNYLMNNGFGGGSTSGCVTTKDEGRFEAGPVHILNKALKTEQVVMPGMPPSISPAVPSAQLQAGVGLGGSNGSSVDVGKLLNGQAPVIKNNGEVGCASNYFNKSPMLSIPVPYHGALDFKVRTGQGGGTKSGNIMDLDGEEEDGNNDSTTSESDEDVSANKCKTIHSHCPDRFKILPGRYPCNFCNIVVEYGPELALHETLKHAQPREVIKGRHGSLKRRYFCARCPFNIIGRRRFLIHHLREHLNLPLEVGMFSKISKYEAPPLTPTTSENSIELDDFFPCDICQAPLSKNNTFARKDHYQAFHNIKGVDPTKINHCDLCPAYFLTGIQLLRHKQQIHSQIPTASFNDKLNGGLIECPTCHEKLKSRLYFNRHMKRHMSQEQQANTHMCDQCGKIFENKSLLDLHSEFHKDPSNWRFQCSICSKKCSTKQSLQVHFRTHTGEKPYVCQVCGEKYGYRHLLRWHVNQKHQQEGIQDSPRPYRKNNYAEDGSHQGRRKDPKNTQFVCDQCSKSFSTKQALQVHGRLHTGEKPFECPACKERFRYRHFLRTHINQKHQDEGIRDEPRPYRKNSDSSQSSSDLVEFQNPSPKPINSQVSQKSGGFECAQCSKSFSTKQAMQVHFRTHTGEKPFACQVCGEKFRYRHVLRTHVNTKHESEGIRDVPRPYHKRNM